MPRFTFVCPTCGEIEAQGKPNTKFVRCPTCHSFAERKKGVELPGFRTDHTFD